MRLLLLILCCISFTTFGQQKYAAVDKSPLDVIYYPANYPVLKIQDKITEPLLARVLYSRPQKNGRPIFGDLISYDKVWRLGANEATEIEFFQNVVINKTRVKKGRYTLYAIPSATKWLFILNRDTDTWGTFKYDEKKDVVRVEAAVEEITELVENLSMTFSKGKDVYFLSVAWDNVQVSLPFTLQL